MNRDTLGGPADKPPPLFAPGRVELAVAIVTALFLGLIAALMVHIWGGDEFALCDETPGTRCPIGSGASWTWTGAAWLTPVAMVAGFLWSRYLRSKGKLGPFVRFPMPDWEEWLEAVAVILGLAISYFLIRQGPKVPIVDATWINSWLAGHLGTRGGADLVPSRATWFVIGSLVAAPFAFSLGSAIGREWYRWRNR